MHNFMNNNSEEAFIYEIITSCSFKKTQILKGFDVSNIILYSLSLGFKPHWWNIVLDETIRATTNVSAIAMYKNENEKHDTKESGKFS